MRKYYSPLIGAALAAASLFQFSLPAFAAGTTAGTDLINNATATYKDADENEYNVTSNRVTVTVGKVAGITNVANGNTSSGPILSGQAVGFDFRVTNTGNDVSSIFIPDSTTIANYDGTTDNLTVNSVQYSVDGGENFIARPDDGIVPNIAEDDSIVVRVNVTIDSTATDGASVAVQLGNTGPNDNTVDTQNQPDEIAGNSDIAARDVRTVTATAASGDPDPEVAGDPVNGQREASAVNTTEVNAVPLALPRITKASAGVDQNGSPTNVQDDIVTYNLDLDVLSSGLPDYTSPNFSFSIEDLEGRDYSAGPLVDGAEPMFDPVEFADRSNLILMSDAIPAGTSLRTTTDGGGVVSAVGVESPTGWTPVYTSSPLSVPADEAIWRSDLNDTDVDESNITRIGWVYDASTDANGSVAQGTNFTGFSFEVITDGIENVTTDIYNLAQVFGSTDDDDDETTAGAIVFDESGDQNPSNFNDDGSGRTDETVITANIDDGEGGTTAVYGYAISPEESNIDPGSNTGTGPAGEFDEVTVVRTAQVTSSILNGPGAYNRPGDTADVVSEPDALGTFFGVNPADDNHDFQNLSTDTPATNSFDEDGNVTTTYNPTAKTFNNTVQNNGSNSINAVLEPISPAYPGLGGAADDLPDGTIVTIAYGGETAQYTYNVTSVEEDITGSFTLADGDTPIVTASILPDNTEDYTVTVQLPENTELSTNLDANSPSGFVGGFPVPIIAYNDTNGNDDLDLTAVGADIDADNESHNVTINQLYTGFLRLDKTATIIGLTDPTNPDSPIGEVDRDPIPGDVIQYNITYTNISEEASPGASGNLLLEVDDLVVTEDGTAGDTDGNGVINGSEAGNNWALDNDGDGIIDTLHVSGSAGEAESETGGVSGSSSVTVNYSDDDGPLAATESSVTGEIVEYQFGPVSNVAPGESGTVTFQRTVTEDNEL